MSARPAPAAAPDPRAAGGLGSFTVVAAIALAAWALRLAVLAHAGAGLYVDEAQYWVWSRDLQWGYFSKPPMIAALIAASTALFGDGLVGLKALVMACYPLTALALYGLGRDLAGSRAGTWAALIFLASPLVGLLGETATTDAPLLLAWSLALWAAWRAVVLGRALAWAGLALALGAGLLSKYTMAALVPGLLVFAWRHGGWAAFGKAVLAVVAGLALFAPHLAWNADWGWPTLGHTVASTDAHTGRGMSAPLRFALLALAQLVAIGPVALWLAWRGNSMPRPRPGAARDLLLAGSVLLLAAGAAQALRGRVEVNWLAPAHVAFALALGLRAPAGEGTRRWSIGLAAQALCIAALVLLPAAWSAWRPGTWPPPALDLWARMRGWQPALAQLEPAAAPYRGAWLVTSSRQGYSQALHEWRTLELRPAGFNPDGVASHHFELRCPWRAASRQPGPFLLLTEGEPSAELRAAFDDLKPLGRATLPYAKGKVLDLHLLVAPAARPAPAAAGAAAVRGDCR